MITQTSGAFGASRGANTPASAARSGAQFTAPKFEYTPSKTSVPSTADSDSMGTT